MLKYKFADEAYFQAVEARVKKEVLDSVKFAKTLIIRIRARSIRMCMCRKITHTLRINPPNIFLILFYTIFAS
jgi:hypothetical protein